MQGVYKVYSGKSDKCTCGCAGKYSYTAEGAVKHNPGYDVNVNERSVKIIMNKMLRNSNTIREDNMMFLDQDGRLMIAWMEKV